MVLVSRPRPDCETPGTAALGLSLGLNVHALIQQHVPVQEHNQAAHEAREIDEVVERLQARFPDIARERVRAAVTDAHHAFDGRPIRDFVPVFVERTARAALSTPTL